MPKIPEPDSRPVDVYKDFIDLLVSETSQLGSATKVRKWQPSDASGSGEAIELLRSLSPEQRNVLATWLHNERTGAIHDVLSVLTWYIVCHDVALTFRGERMPVELWDMGIHADYISRLEGHEWPESDRSGEA